MKDCRILTVQDVSCVGQCSLTVALPILSAMGIETAILPSAVLSTHTGGFTGFTFRDLTEDLVPIMQHWQKEKIFFDAFYTGYVGSPKQLAYITDIIDNTSKKDSLVIIDPVLGDKGKLYTGFTDDFPAKMAQFCAKADVILPNFTEAAFMLNEKYIEDHHTKEYVEDMLHKLKGLGAKNVLLTGVSLEEGKVGVATLNGKTGEVSYYFRDFIGGAFHGTGDVFASSFTGAMVRGYSLEEAAKIAVDFTVKAIECTVDDPSHWYGVKFEKALPSLMKRLGD